jgi:hypothetical protein
MRIRTFNFIVAIGLCAGCAPLPPPPAVNLGYEVVNADSASNNYWLKSQVATCPAGKKVTGGGGFPIFDTGVSGTVSVVALRISTPFTVRNENDSWLVHAFETQPDNFTNWRLRSVAVCASVF